MKTVRKICVVTGTRAEYGLLKPLIKLLHESDKIELQLIATGMHLSPEFGLTYKAIENDGFRITRKVENLLSSDTSVAVAKATGLGLIGFADVYQDLEPDLIVVLGDRFEILAAAVAALYSRITLAHIHGGETTEGAFDEGIRHAITKMAHFHFVAADEYRQRVLQLGENPRHIHTVGAPGIDGILEAELLSKEELSESLEMDLSSGFLLITFHPVTLEKSGLNEQVQALLEALRQIPDELKLIFTLPNADTDGRMIIQLIKDYINDIPERAAAYPSLGQVRYWSALKYCNVVVGNSSSGLLEAPSFGVPTVNIGDRQKGRIATESVIHCEPEQAAIMEALQRAMTPEFCKKAKQIVNPMGDGRASERIFKQLIGAELNTQLLKKHFYTL